MSYIFNEITELNLSYLKLDFIHLLTSSIPIGQWACVQPQSAHHHAYILVLKLPPTLGTGMHLIRLRESALDSWEVISD